jgi:hypothetical protein
MRKSEVLLTLVALVSTATAFWLWSELDAERSRNADLSARVNSPPTTIAAPEAVTPSPAPARALPTSAKSTADSAGAPTKSVAQGGQEGWEAYQRRMMQQPKYREAWRAQQRLAYALRRENVIRLLGLTPEQADSVIELAIDQQLRWYDRPPPDPMTEEYQQQQAVWEEQDEREDQDRLRKLLGDEKNARFQEYMETRNTRMQIDQFRPQFTGADTLRDDQVEPLIAALHVERAQMQKELNEYGATLTSDDASQKYSERRIELMKAAYDRMHAAAAPILSSSQVKRLDALLKRDLERQEAQARMVLVQSKIDSAGTGASNTN